MVDSELERFKTEINLVELASAYGYECVKKQSSRSSIVMAHADGDKIVVATAADGHSVFFSVRESSCGGSVIDFVMYRQGVRLGGARQVLRKCTPEYLRSRAIVHYRPEVGSHDVPAVMYARWLGMQPYDCQDDGYLERRGLNAETIGLFSDRVRVDDRGNVVFRHDDLRSLTGWEIKNRGFTGFAGGGKKALFGCKVGTPGDVPLIILTESAIDALSYYQLKPRPGFYLSFAGGISRDQQELLTWLLHRYPAARIVAATDNDEPGRKYAEWICSVREDAIVDCPFVGKDWNDVLTNREVRR